MLQPRIVRGRSAWYTRLFPSNVFLCCCSNSNGEMTKKKSSNRRKLFVNSASLEQSLAAELIASNVDLLTEILLRLPAKSIIRFKCVSKHWLTLISDHQFACNHARKNSNSLISGIYWKPQLGDQVKSVSLHAHSSLPTLTFLDHLGQASKLLIISSCNGLMMCSHGDGTPYIVCNLTTQKYTVVPYPGSPSSPSLKFHNNSNACLAFDPSKSPHFKVIVATPYYINCHDEERSYEILIYSSLSASWKRLFFPSRRCFSVGHKVFCNGAIHWICKENIHFRFELDAEELIENPIPPKLKILDGVNIRYFEECCGRLLLIQIRKFSAEEFIILEMDTVSYGWIVKHRVNLRPVIALFPETVRTNNWSYSIYRDEIWKFSVLSIIKEANKKDCSLLLGISGKFISYNLKSKKWKVLRDFPPNEFTEYFCWLIGYIRGHQFIESLSPV